MTVVLTVEYFTIPYYRSFKRNWRKNKQNIAFLETLPREEQEITKHCPKRSVQCVPRFNHSEFPTKVDTKVPDYIPMLKQLTVMTLCRVRIGNLNINRNNIGVQLQSIVEHGLLGMQTTPGIREPWWRCVVPRSFFPIGRIDRGPLSPKRRLVVELGLQQVLQVHLRDVVHNVLVVEKTRVVDVGVGALS